MSWFLSFTSWRRGTGAASGETLLLGGAENGRAGRLAKS
jgi:hypothetical protein